MFYIAQVEFVKERGNTYLGLGKELISLDANVVESHERIIEYRYVVLEP